MSTIEQVKLFAGRAHGTQQRKYSGEPYVFHLIRVAAICREFTNDLCIISAAYLHDVLEDTTVTRKEMLAFLETVMPVEMAARTTSLVVDLTDVYVRANYPDMNRKTRKQLEMERLAAVGADAQTIKYADLIDNATDIAGHDTDFSEVYLKEAMDLLGRMDKGHTILYERALNVVNKCYLQVRTVD